MPIVYFQLRLILYLNLTMTKSEIRHKFILLGLIAMMCVPLSISAQFEVGEAAGYGNAGLTLSNAWSLQYNQAGIADIKTIEAGIAYKMPFLLNETANQSLAIAVPVSFGAFGLSVNTFGYSLFREGKYGLSYGKKITEKLNLGVQLNYESIQIGENYGSASVFTVEGGFLYTLNDNISLAGHVYNPNKSTYAEIEKSETASKIKGGFRYTFSEKVFLTGEVWKDSFHKAQVVVGTEFFLLEKLKFRAGISTEPTQSSFGLGLIVKDFQIDLATDYHQELGVTPNISLRYVRP